MLRFLILPFALAFATACSDAPEATDPDVRPITGEAIPDASATDTLFARYDGLAEPVEVDTAAARAWVDETLAAMSQEEKIGQLMLVNLPSSGAEALVERHHVGGFLVPRLLEPREVRQRTQALQNRATVPLFFAADYERGVGRFNNNLTELPSNMALGAIGDPALAAAFGRLSAIEARAIGVNLLLAPVVDVNNNPANPIINIRSYGEDPEVVGELAAAFVEAAQAYGVLTTLKHFPGHGDTATDSHAKLGVVEGDRAKLDRLELRPYAVVFERAEPAAVMTAHLWIQALDGEALPATFSENALTGLLRDELGFEGVVMTDDVKMGALSGTYPLPERVVRPLEAGADVILTPDDVGRAVAAVQQALASGRLSQERLDASVRRILWAKARAGLHRDARADSDLLDALLAEPLGAPIAEAAAAQALTLLDPGGVLPFAADAALALVQFSNVQNSESIPAAMDRFASTLADDLVLDRRFSADPSAAQR